MSMGPGQRTSCPSNTPSVRSPMSAAVLPAARLRIAIAGLFAEQARHSLVAMRKKEKYRRTAHPVK